MLILLGYARCGDGTNLDTVMVDPFDGTRVRRDPLMLMRGDCDYVMLGPGCRATLVRPTEACGRARKTT